MWGAIAGAALGALAGSQGNKSSTSGFSDIELAPASETETNATNSINDIFKQIQGFSNLGPGAQDITNGYNAQLDLGNMLKSFAQGNYGPTQQDFDMAKLQTQPQQVALDQSLRDARIQQQRQAAVSGRGANDFTFNNRLNRNAMDSQMQIGAQQSQIASQQPMQRLNFQSQYATLQGGLATQALQNRSAILSLGQQIQQSERNFRLASANKSYGQTTTSGGGTMGAISGALAGAGAGATGFANMFSGFGGGDSSGGMGGGGGAKSSMGYSLAP